MLLGGGLVRVRCGYLAGLAARGVVCFTATPGGPQVRTWMIGQLWRATSGDAARIECRITKAYAAAQCDQQEAAEQQTHRAAEEAVAEASGSCGITAGLTPTSVALEPGRSHVCY